MTASGREVRGWRDRAKRKKDSWTTVWGLLGGGEEGIRRINGNGKRYNKDLIKKLN